MGGVALMKRPEAEPNDGGGMLNVFQAFQVSFCIAFGAGIALVGWYPKLAGIWGFALVITIVSASGGIAENALHVTAIRNSSWSFAALCEILPGFMGKITSLSMIAWGFTLAGLYTRYVFTFINKQVVAGLLGNEPFPGDGLGSLMLYVPIGCVVYLITLPPKFSGTVVKVITNVNLVTTWVVIFTAIAKAIYMMNNTTEEQKHPDYEQWEPAGFLQVTVLLAGAMFQCSAVPRLQYEIQPACRQRASFIIPLMLAVVQGVVFFVIGILGYLALGECVHPDGDVFNTYNDIRPDGFVSVLQGGIALLMFLSLPLLGVPPKSELWAVVQARKPEKDKVPFEESPLIARLLINLFMVTYATFLAPTLGSAGVTVLVTILAGTAANWLNLFLPSFVNLYANIIPSRREGTPWGLNAAKAAWILLIATVCFINSLVKIYKEFFEEKPPKFEWPCQGSEFCWKLAGPHLNLTQCPVSGVSGGGPKLFGF